MKNDLLDYSIQMSILSTLLKKQLLSKAEYNKVLIKLKKKYKIRI